jgi:signal transduction histidine kinase
MGDPMGGLEESLHAQRTEIAGQIHDQVIPPLFAARMQLEALASKLRAAGDSGKTLETATVLSSVDRAAEFVVQSMLAAREVLSDVSPPLTGQRYWQQQIELVGDLLSTRVDEDGQPVKLKVSGDFPFSSTPAETAIVVTNIVTEAIRNAIRHSNADTIDVVIAPSPNRQITVTDNGSGFDPGSIKSNHGMLLMKSRAKSIGGQLKIDSRPGGPTHLTITWPQ